MNTRTWMVIGFDPITDEVQFKVVESVKPSIAALMACQQGLAVVTVFDAQLVRSGPALGPGYVMRPDTPEED